MTSPPSPLHPLNPPYEAGRIRKNFYHGEGERFSAEAQQQTRFVVETLAQ
ncbi:MAG UNVERIFIED_CONTAM: hypothetical protein LVR29_04050 [Microcystis novacekii LVE1205-3]